ncbi:MAG: response regulator [Chloroflexi bacterium]|nr:response regulator [Chloroflexota bacterium]
MKTLIVEDDFTSRLLMQELLKGFGMVNVAVDGQEGVEAVRLALKSGEPFNLICLDIMMPELDGQQTLRVIREMEEDKGILSSDGAKIIMTTALDDMKNKISAFSGLCDGYLSKPIHKEQLLKELRKLELIS